MILREIIPMLIPQCTIGLLKISELNAHKPKKSWTKTLWHLKWHVHGI